MRFGSRGWTKFASHEHTRPNCSVSHSDRFFCSFTSRESAWIKLQLAWPEAALPWSFRLCGGPASRWSRFLATAGRCSAALAHLCEGIRAGRQTGRLSLCRFQTKKKVISSSTVSTSAVPVGVPQLQLSRQSSTFLVWAQRQVGAHCVRTVRFHSLQFFQQLGAIFWSP